MADASNRLLAAIRMPSVAARCEDELVIGLARWSDLAFAMVAHADGRPFAARAIEAKTLLPRLCAQARSLMATSDVISKDAGGGSARQVVVAMDSGVFVTVKVPGTQDQLVLSVRGAPSASVGLALHAALDISSRVGAVVATTAPKGQAGS